MELVAKVECETSPADAIGVIGSVRMPDPTQVRQMFTRVAPRYDLANHVLSMGVDHLWRRAMVRFAELKRGEKVLDVCAGTGDSAFALAKAGADVTGGDFCAAMLQRAQQKNPSRPPEQRVRFACADATRLPFDDDQFDLATVAFGIRNVEDPVAGLREMHRVVRPGGRVVVLEFSRSRTPVVRGLFGFYFHRILPRVGGLLSGDSAPYRYLPDSVDTFPDREDFLDRMRAAGLRSSRYRSLSCGIAAIYRGEVETIAGESQGPS